MVNTKRVLIVEDDVAMSVLINRILVRAGYNVQHVLDGLSALKMVDVFLPDAIVLDMYLPKLNGWEFVAHYRQTNQVTPIVATSAAALDFATLQGIQAFVAKPFRSQELINAVALSVPA
jgi:CheY-like chemotaxis protein